MIEVHLKTTGILLIILALAHSVFPKYFNWKNDLDKISLVNKQMMYVHTFFIALTLTLMGILCLTSADDLVETKLGNRISLGLGVFWLIRLFIQFFGYSSMLWKGKRLETGIHIIFTLLWIYVSTVFLYIFFMRSSTVLILLTAEGLF